jgi:hypothetical protein
MEGREVESAAFEKTIRAIADRMCYKVTFTENKNRAHIYSLVQGSDYYDDIFIREVDERLWIVGKYPDAEDGSRFSAWQAVISVAGNRPAAQIVKEIERRLLPKYRKSLAEVIKKVKEWNAMLHSQASRIEALAEICGVTMFKVDWRGNKVGFYLGGKNARGDIRVDGDSILIELGGIAFEKAHAMLMALME